MVKHEIMIIADYSQSSEISLRELSEIAGLSLDELTVWMSYDIIRPAFIANDEYYFTLAELQRLKTALRLQRDLELNLAGIALVLELLAEVQDLREQNALLERHILQR